MMIRRVLMAVAALYLGACDCAGPAPVDCVSDDECPMTDRCRDGLCVARTDSGLDAGARPTDGGDGGGTDAGDFRGERCGASLPCPTGWTCVGGLCDLDCGAQARCAGSCCGDGEVCNFGACIVPGPSCEPVGALTCVTPRCPAEQECDPSLGVCVPIPADSTCRVSASGTFEPVVLWAWEGSSEHTAFRHAIATPAIADLDGDGSNDVIVSVADYFPGGPGVGGILCALSGAGDCAGGPRELWCTAPTDPRVLVLGSPAVADLDGDGELTIIQPAARPGPRGNVYGLDGYDASGNRLPMFGTDSAGAPVDTYVYVGAPGVADLDADGRAEVYAGFTVFDADGRLLWTRPGGEGNAGFGALSVAADLDGDGRMELVGGNMAYEADGTEHWAAGVAARTFPTGWPAVADVDLDGSPEIIVVAEGVVRIFNADGSRFTTSEATFPGVGGPPTVADVDGDGDPEIAVAGSDSLSVFDVGPAPDFTLSLLWRASSRDFSSNITGSSVFDFDGDGRNEVIYGDECFARVYDGLGDGGGGASVRFEVPNTSCTGTEYPVVADVNGDGKANFVVVSNDLDGTGSACAPYARACRTAFPGYVGTTGVRVYRDRLDNWVPTRGIWNQHTYHVTNVCDGRDSVCPMDNGYGRVPRVEPSSWSFPAAAPLNSYRVNAELDNANGAPDLVVELVLDLSGCPTAMVLHAIVSNGGAIGVAAGVEVLFSQRQADGTLVEIGRASTTTVLPAGASERVSVTWDPLPAGSEDTELTVVAEVDSATAFNECVEDNNTTGRTVICSGLM